MYDILEWNVITWRFLLWLKRALLYERIHKCVLRVNLSIASFHFICHLLRHKSRRHNNETNGFSILHLGSIATNPPSDQKKSTHLTSSQLDDYVDGDGNTSEVFRSFIISLVIFLLEAFWIYQLPHGYLSFIRPVYIYAFLWVPLF